MIVAIDGPAGSGKSTVARRVAERLGFHYLDTGAMYRAVAVAALRAGIPVTDEARVSEIAATSTIAFEHSVQHAAPVRVFIDGDDVTEAIRTPEADHAVSPVARIAAVREALVLQQRRLASADDTVLEGRDIGTVVFPNADVKVYLTASEDVRAARRASEQQARGLAVTHDEVLGAIQRRDSIDSNRTVSPLSAADDAFVLDTSALAIDEVVDEVVGRVRGGSA